MDMMLKIVYKVYFREKYIKRRDEDLPKVSMNLETDLYKAEVTIQSISIKDEMIPYIQILCNDKKDKAKLEKFLLDTQYILCFENNKQRHFSKWARTDEK